MTRAERDRRIVDTAPAILPPALWLAHEALLLWAAECEPDAWPTVPAVIRFARAYEVDPQELGAMVGIVSFRLTPRGRVVWCDSQRFPELVRRTNPGRLTRAVQRGYGYFCAVAALVERDRATAVH